MAALASRQVACCYAMPGKPNRLRSCPDGQDLGRSD